MNVILGSTLQKWEWKSGCFFVPGSKIPCCTVLAVIAVVTLLSRSLGRSHLGGNFMAIFSRKGALFWSPPHLLHPLSAVSFSGYCESRFSSVMLYSKALNVSTPWMVVAMFFPQVLAGVVGAICRPIWLNVRRARAQPRARALR